MSGTIKHPVNILIVDDRLENLQVLSRVLQSLSYEIRTVTSGAEALQAVAEHPPTLVLLDIMMPGMDGYEVCRHLKQDPTTADIPVIFISALNQLEQRMQAFEVGGVDYITKPFQVAEVIMRVRTHLRLYQQQQEIELLHQRLQRHNDELAQTVRERTAQLDRLNHRMATILGSITDGILLLNHDGTVSMTNNGFDAMMRAYPDAYFGRSICDFASDDGRHHLQEALMLVQTGQKPAPVHLAVKRHDGTMMDASLTLAPVAGDEEHLVCTCHDISQLKEAERMKDNFVSMVTHELRTPITSMMLLSNGLNKYYDRMDEDLRRQKLHRMNEQVIVMAELVESVLDTSRLEARNRPRTLNKVNLAQVAERVSKELSPAIHEKEHRLSLNHDEGTIVAGDVIEFARIWRNLIHNAIKYTSQQGHIVVATGTLTVRQEGTHWSPSLTIPPGFETQLPAGCYVIGQVRDTGHGIAPDDIPQLFTRFYRGWAKQSNIQGTGLGLSLVRDLLELYGGGIHVYSELGVGSLFTFWLNCVQSETKEALS